MTKTQNIKAKNLREQDPYLERERAKYDNHPLPSREWIIQLLEEAGIPQKAEVLAKELSIKPQEMDFFERRLKAMARDGQILINRRGLVCVAKKLDIMKCRVEAHKDGFGFAIPLGNTTEGDLVLYERQMRGVMHGDIVTVRPLGLDRRGRREGQVLDIVERAQSKVVGRFYMERGVAVLEPEDKRLHQNIILEPDSVAEFQPASGQVVVVEIDSYPENHRPAVAKIVEVLGDYADSGMEIEIAVRKHRLPHEFSEACLKATAKIPDNVRATDRKNRVDLRDMPLVTIDGESSRDFDDAVFAEKIGRNYRLVVAIADVSHYVQPHDAVDDDARERATSVYFPRRVIPMLPENLSNGICSLNPDVERLCMVCDITFTYAGNVKSYEFYPAVMKSVARLTYTQVWDWLQNGLKGAPSKFSVSLKVLYQLFSVLQKKRQARGAMEFETTETEMLFNENGKIERIVPVQRNDAHKLIEECMLAANVCAADFLLKNKHSALYRNHKGPTPEKLANLREQLGLLGLQLGGGDNPTPKHYAQLAEKIGERSDRQLIQTMLLRSMQQAVYEPENEGHFGLAYEQYAHFTSPIRRYPDLLVHRAIKAVLQGKRYDTSWQEIGAHASYAERRADDAGSDVESWLKTYYMRDKVGETFSGKITHIANFGIFVTLDDIHIEGMVHVSDLGEDYFNYRPDLLAMVGERSGVRFNMGDSVIVKVARADLETSKIDLVLVQGNSNGKKGSLKNSSAQETNAAQTENSKTRRGNKNSANKAVATTKSTIKTEAKTKTTKAVKQAEKTSKTAGVKTGQAASKTVHSVAKTVTKTANKTSSKRNNKVQTVSNDTLDDALNMAAAAVAKVKRKARTLAGQTPVTSAAKNKIGTHKKGVSIKKQPETTLPENIKTASGKVLQVVKETLLGKGETMEKVKRKRKLK